MRKGRLPGEAALFVPRAAPQGREGMPAYFVTASRVRWPPL